MSTSEGFISDELGNALKVGDMIALKGACYIIMEIRSPSLVSVDPTQRNTNTPRLVFIRAVHDITLTAEFGKKIREVYKIQQPQETGSPN